MEFTDVKSKDFIELAGVPEHRQGTVIAEHRVKWRLRETLENSGITYPYEHIFFTTWNEDGVVNYSKSLVQLLTEAVVDSEPPSIGMHGGLFGRMAVTSSDELLNIDQQTVDEAIQIVYRHIKDTEQAG
ncbi:hypothetical protein E2H86_21115 [Pseudomonas putida]|uniref:hypothetical protein n=1 Tax=Pseudomonas TaxID=286 RepID=UPI00105A6024|nr:MULTISPECIES: hypothetical protein [Pseudomonas]MBF8746669.1 hypothetical protein [Pseudomonas monteilii]MCT8162609.1 hypothetical protein [Pseudomonas sp. HD6422]MCT8184309.1 hypothetical protein [Pseudomonas sp. HD6421]TDJ74304.1 hypothetical protein E2H86_21115 [Pseudomonas putida]